MKQKTLLSRLLTCMIVALVGVILFATPARATVPYIDENGAAFNCRRVTFDGDGMTWSSWCYRYQGEEFDYDVFWDDEGALVPVGEDFYVLLGYHALTVELTAESGIFISDGSSASYVATSSDGAYIYRIPAGTGDVTLKTRGTMMGTFDPAGYYYPPASSGLPRACAVTINADEGFSGFSDFMSMEGDPNWVGYPIHVKKDGTYTIYMWEGSPASFTFGANGDIYQFEVNGDIDVNWGGGVAISMCANDTGEIVIRTSDKKIMHDGLNGWVYSPISEDALIALKGLTFNMYPVDAGTEDTVLMLCAKQIRSIVPQDLMWTAYVYEPKLETFFGSSVVDFEEIYSNNDYFASFPISLSVLSNGDMADQGYLVLMDKTTHEFRQIVSARTMERNGSVYTYFDTTIGELLNSYVIPFAAVDEPQQTGWTQTPSGAYVYYKDDGTLLIDDWGQADNGSWYYADTNGQLVWNGLARYGTKHYVVKNGSVVTKQGWQSVGGAYYYVGKDSAAYRNQWLNSNGTYYYFGDDCKLVINGWAPAGSSRYFMGSNGQVVVSNWAQVDGDYSYFNEKGQMVTNAFVYYNRYYYLMDGYGHPIRNQKNYSYGGYLFNFDAYGRCTWSNLG